MMPADLKELLRVLNVHNVKFLVVGGYALGVWTEPRATKDLDILIRSDEQNSEAIYRALTDFGAPMQNLSPPIFVTALASSSAAHRRASTFFSRSTESASIKPGRTAR